MSERKYGELRHREGVIEVWNGTEWELVDTSPRPRFTLYAPGVWYVSRNVQFMWHGEGDDTLKLKGLGKEEREVAKVLLRCALDRLEAMED